MNEKQTDFKKLRADLQDLQRLAIAAAAEALVGATQEEIEGALRQMTDLEGFKLVPAHDPLFSVRRDAERYRVLRKLVGAEMTRHGLSAYLPCGAGGLKPEETDAAIDAAIASGNTG